MKEKEIEKIEEIVETKEKNNVREQEKESSETVKKGKKKKSVKQVQEEQSEEKIEVEEKEQQEQIKEQVIEKTDATILESKTEEVKGAQEENKKADGLHRYTKVITVISVLLVIAAMIFSTIFALLNKTNEKIVKGVFVKGIDVSQLTKQEASEKLNKVFSNEIKKDITLKHADFETVVTPEQIEMNFKLSEAIDFAYSIGRTGKVLKDNYDIINASLSKIEINPAYSYNDEVLTNFITSTQGNLPDIVQQSSYSIDGDKLIIDKGQKGVCIDQESLKKQIVDKSVEFRTRKCCH